MRSLAYSNTAKPTRPVCPRCSKKGISVWHTIETVRDRNCRYCNYTEFQTYVFNDRDYSGTWLTTDADKARQDSYNGEKTT